MITVEPVKIKFPVCTGTLCDQLSNEQSVIEDQIYHYNDENDEGLALENLHPLVILLRMAFDSSGGCTQFDYLGIRPG